MTASRRIVPIVNFSMLMLAPELDPHSGEAGGKLGHAGQGKRYTCGEVRCQVR